MAQASVKGLENEKQRSSEYQGVGDVCAECPHTHMHGPTWDKSVPQEHAISSYPMFHEDGASPFAHCLPFLTNLDTLHILHAYSQMTTIIHHACESHTLPSIRTVVLASCPLTTFSGTAPRSAR